MKIYQVYLNLTNFEQIIDTRMDVLCTKISEKCRIKFFRLMQENRFIENYLSTRVMHLI